MRILSLTLKGFRGIRDGMRRDVLALDIERLAFEAALVPITGANGRGNTTHWTTCTRYVESPYVDP
jgi:exonuclease SbcC